VESDDPAPRWQPGGYGSRIEQLLCENPDMPIMITDAGKSPENGGRYIVYTIRTGVRGLPPPFIPAVTQPHSDLGALGPGSQAAVFGICVAPRGACSPAPDARHPSDSGEALNGGLRREPDAR
jgi:hypothetical protein